MKYLPIENMILESKLDANEIISRIKNNTEKPNSVKIKDVFKTKERKYFVGRIREKSFNVSRIIANRNAFRPVILGEVKDGENETIINVKMKLDLIVIVFLSVIIGAISVAFLVFLLASINSKSIDFIVFIPLGAMLFIYVIIMLGFKSESSTSKKYLKKLFEANIVRREIVK